LVYSILNLVISGDTAASTFSVPTTISLPLGTETPQGLAIGDIDGDLIDDIVVADPANNQILLLKNVGVGNVASISSYTVTGGSIDVKLVDVNNDGMLDIITINPITSDTTIILNGLILF